MSVWVGGEKIKNYIQRPSEEKNLALAHRNVTKTKKNSVLCLCLLQGVVVGIEFYFFTTEEEAFQWQKKYIGKTIISLKLCSKTLTLSWKVVFPNKCRLKIDKSLRVCLLQLEMTPPFLIRRIDFSSHSKWSVHEWILVSFR